MNQTPTARNGRSTWSMAFHDGRSRFSRERYRSQGTRLAYLGFGAILLFVLPALAYTNVIAPPGRLVTTGFALSLLMVWTVYGIVTDAILSRWFASWPAPAQTEDGAMAT